MLAGRMEFDVPQQDEVHMCLRIEGRTEQGPDILTIPCEDLLPRIDDTSWSVPRALSIG